MAKRITLAEQERELWQRQLRESREAARKNDATYFASEVSLAYFRSNRSLSAAHESKYQELLRRQSAIKKLGSI